MSPPRSVIPPALAADLKRLGERLVQGAPIGPELDATLSGLGRLAPGAVALADGEIANLAGLNRFRSHPVRQLGLLNHALNDLQCLALAPALAPLFLFHRDGYVREAALDRIVTPPSSAFFFAALGLRLNDWAGPVRQAARRCVLRVAASAAPEVAAEVVLFLLGRQNQWLRWSEGHEILDVLLDRPEIAERLVQRIANATAGPFAHLLRLALRNPVMDAHLRPLSLTARQPAVRAAALQTLLCRRASWTVGFEQQWTDRRFGEGRRVASLAHRAVDHDNDLTDLLRTGLTDRSALVRRVAADELTRDPAGFPHLAWAIARLEADPNKANRERGDFLRRSRAPTSAS